MLYSCKLHTWFMWMIVFDVQQTYEVIIVFNKKKLNWTCNVLNENPNAKWKENRIECIVMHIHCVLGARCALHSNNNISGLNVIESYWVWLRRFYFLFFISFWCMFLRCASTLLYTYALWPTITKKKQICVIIMHLCEHIDLGEFWVYVMNSIWCVSRCVAGFSLSLSHTVQIRHFIRLLKPHSTNQIYIYELQWK